MRMSRSQIWKAAGCDSFSTTAKSILETGESLQIPSNVAHSVEALEDSVALDLFVPVREDWVRGDDAYLRRS